jgi:hypothetical protein
MQQTCSRTPTPFQYVVGLDLGQVQDFTALAIVEWNDRPAADGGPRYERHFGVRHLQRWPLGTPYPAIVADVREMFAVSALVRGAPLVVDQTGVGAAVVDLFRVAELGGWLKPVSITCGLQPGDGTVPKKDLVGAVLVPLQNGRLQIAETLELAETLGKELETFRTKVTADRNETFAAWREREHDDLVLAVALAVYDASSQPGYDPDPYGDIGPAPGGDVPPGVFRGAGGQMPSVFSGRRPDGAFRGGGRLGSSSTGPAIGSGTGSGPAFALALFLSPPPDASGIRIARLHAGHETGRPAALSGDFIAFPQTPSNRIMGRPLLSADSRVGGR